ncbi:MAG: DUF6503 family protein [Cyclobacteriaceae bacterium]
MMKLFKHPQHIYRLFAPVFYLGILSLMSSCGDSKGQRILDDSIEAHGGSSYKSFHLEFDFRSRHYTAARKNGIFTYTREFTDTTGRIKDVLNNDGLIRYRNDSILAITDERRKAFTNSVNSVIYFALLPYGLNDDAANKEWIKETTIKGQPYEVVRVTFDKTAGVDHQDVFLYWFHKEKRTMDYFAYSYESDGGGIRFREAINPRRIGGILWQDYVNYNPKDETLPLDTLQSMFISGTLEKLSEIKMENITVSDYQ